MSPEHLKQYVTLAFRVALPRTKRPILVAFDGQTEMWIVVVDADIYVMAIGSDDDEFSFHCATGNKPRVTFPLPPEMQ